MTLSHEERAEIRDTIEVCETYLEDARAHEGRNMGPFSHLFDTAGVDFARAQIAFERARLEEDDTLAEEAIGEEDLRVERGLMGT